MSLTHVTPNLKVKLELMINCGSINKTQKIPLILDSCLKTFHIHVQIPIGNIYVDPISFFSSQASYC